MNPFKKFCISFIAVLLLYVLVVHPALFFANLGVEDVPARGIDNWFKIKEAHARNSIGRKIFVLGGSCILYGVDTELMENKLGITTVNFGTTGSMQEYMFTRIRPSLGSGDVVIIPLDYGFYPDRPLEEGNFVYVLEYDKEYFERLPFVDKVIYVYGLGFPFLAKRLIARAVSEEQGDDGSHFLSSKYLNANGDLTSNTYEKRVYAKPRIPLRWFFRSSAFPGKWMQQIIANFAEYCSGLNVRIYATWPPVYSPTDKKEFYGRDAEIIEAIKRFWAELNIPMIGDYRDVFMEPEDCFTDYIHINWRGKQKYTKHLIELIRPYI